MWKRKSAVALTSFLNNAAACTVMRPGATIVASFVPSVAEYAHALTESSNSLVANEHLITKVYFPRLVVPIAAVLGGLVDFGVAFVILIAMILYYGIVPGWTIITLPGFVVRRSARRNPAAFLGCNRHGQRSGCERAQE